MFVDGDDWIERNMIEKMLDASNSETELIVSNYFIDTQNQTIEGITIPLYTSSKKKILYFPIVDHALRYTKVVSLKKIQFFP